MKTINEVRQQLESKRSEGKSIIVCRWIDRNSPTGLLTVQKETRHNINYILSDEGRLRRFTDNFNLLEDYHIV